MSDVILHWMRIGLKLCHALISGINYCLISDFIFLWIALRRSIESSYMEKHTNHYIPQFALIAYLVIALLLVQTFKLHAHIQHDGTPSSPTTEHSVDVHMAFSQHDTSYDIHHQDVFQDHLHSAEIDVSSSHFIKKTQLLNPFALLFFITSIILCISGTGRFQRRYYSRQKRPSDYYLLRPPLRAPPL